MMFRKILNIETLLKGFFMFEIYSFQNPAYF